MNSKDKLKLEMAKLISKLERGEVPMDNMCASLEPCTACHGAAGSMDKDCIHCDGTGEQVDYYGPKVHISRRS